MTKTVHMAEPEKDMAQVSHLDESHGHGHLYNADGDSLAATHTRGTDTEKGSLHSHGHGSEGDAYKAGLKKAERHLLRKLGACTKQNRMLIHPQTSESSRSRCSCTSQHT